MLRLECRHYIIMQALANISQIGLEHLGTFYRLLYNLFIKIRILCRMKYSPLRRDLNALIFQALHVVYLLFRGKYALQRIYSSLFGITKQVSVKM